MTCDWAPQEGALSNFTASLDLRAGGFDWAACVAGVENVALEFWLGLAFADCCCALAEAVATSAASGFLADDDAAVGCFAGGALASRSTSFGGGTATASGSFAPFAVSLFFLGELEPAVAVAGLGAGCFRMT